MQLFTLLSVILACIVAASAIPLRLTDVHDQLTTFEPELKDALGFANQQVEMMLKTIDEAKKTPDGAAMGRIKMAFGPNPPMAKIETNIRALVKGKMRVSEIDDDSIYARTHYTIPKDPTSPVETVINKKKFKAQTLTHRTSTVLHEAAHYLWQAGDDYVDIDGATRMIPMGHIYTTGERDPAHYRIKGGYALKANYHTPLEATDLKDLFIRGRDTAPNIDLNASSYALLGMLCAHHEIVLRGLLKGTNQPSGSGGPGTLARPVTPSGSGGSHQEDAGSPTTSTRPVTPVAPNPESGSGGATTSSRPVTPDPASGSGGATTPATPVAPDPPSRSSKWNLLKPNPAGRRLVKPNPAGTPNQPSGSGGPTTPATPVTPDPAIGSGKPRKLVKKPRESHA